MRLKTRYKTGEIPHSEHPRPQAERKGWLCLNGKWNFYKQDINGEKSFDGEILVPFSPETLLSGIAEDFLLKENEMLVYTRSFALNENTVNGTVFLHFGAVDSECEVLVNGQKAGAHKGGFTPFDLDISALVKTGENELTVYCRDEAFKNEGARGKQSANRGGIWYTPQSGIWQTVWLEFMPKKYISGLKITTDPFENEVRIVSDSFGEMQTARIFDGDTEILSQSYQTETVFCYPFERWSPENPKLYTLVLTNESGDELQSYFGVRAFGKARDKRGVQRLTLNGKPYFFNGVLDQGYWSDGMLTYPCDEAAFEELKMLKDMGFNTVRKHIKLEPMRWYYHCDKLGLIVWQDFVNGGGEYKFTHIAAFPFLGFKHRDDDYKYFARENASGRAEFEKAVDETLSALYNCTCIGVWVPFNEGWGQFDSGRITEYIKSQDSTRIIDSVSGWHDQGAGKTELKSLHTYYTPLRVPKDERPVVLSEFGGYSMQTKGHVFDESKEFGYKKFKTQAELIAALEKLFLKKLKPLIQKGLCGSIYTQVSDVEEEINGLVTYDREVIKVPIEVMKKINSELFEEASLLE